MEEQFNYTHQKGILPRNGFTQDDCYNVEIKCYNTTEEDNKTYVLLNKISEEDYTHTSLQGVKILKITHIVKGIKYIFELFYDNEDGYCGYSYTSTGETDFMYLYDVMSDTVKLTELICRYIKLGINNSMEIRVTLDRLFINL